MLLAILAADFLIQIVRKKRILKARVERCGKSPGTRMNTGFTEVLRGGE